MKKFREHRRTTVEIKKERVWRVGARERIKFYILYRKINCRSLSLSLSLSLFLSLSRTRCGLATEFVANIILSTYIF